MQSICQKRLSRSLGFLCLPKHAHTHITQDKEAGGGSPDVPDTKCFVWLVRGVLRAACAARTGVATARGHRCIDPASLRTTGCSLRHVGLQLLRYKKHVSHMHTLITQGGPCMGYGSIIWNSKIFSCGSNTTYIQLDRDMLGKQRCFFVADNVLHEGGMTQI